MILQRKLSMTNIPVAENWTDDEGRYSNYDTDPNLFETLRNRRHTDLRSFSVEILPGAIYMFNLDETMTEMDLLAMEDIEPGEESSLAEPWSLGAVGPTTEAGMRNALTVTIPSAGTYVTSSSTNHVDVSDFDQLSISFIKLDSTKINLATSTMTFGDGVHTDIVLPLNTAVLTGTRGYIEWPVSTFASLDNIFSITFSFVGTATTSVIVGAIRAIDNDWIPGQMDIQTVTNRLVPTINLDASLNTTPDPVIWRSDDIPGITDPRPINVSLGVVFYTGSQTENNNLSLYLRGRREDFLTQLDLDGSDGVNLDGTPLFGDNQFTLDREGHQPNYGQARYVFRPQEDLEGLTQAEMETDTSGDVIQAELERLSDNISESHVRINLQWGPTPQLIIDTPEAPNWVVFDLTDFDSNSKYLMIVNLNDSGIQVILYPLLVQGAIDEVNPAFNSGIITDEFVLFRRKGRIGWAFDILDGDAYVESIRSRGMMFNEIITNNLESLTPVDGARIFFGGTPNRQINLAGGPFRDSIFEADLHNSQSDDGSVKVTAGLGSGLQTGFTDFDDFEHSAIVFDLWYPQAAIDNGDFLDAQLVNQEGFTIPLVLPTLAGDKWQTIRIRTLRASNEQSGSYGFRLTQNGGPYTWWIDNLFLSRQTIVWSGRATLQDPWGREDLWTDFLNLTNSETNGVLFPERGRYVQIRGQTLIQEASIDKLYVKPKYAELGRLVNW
jgi:hypothetical protein